MTTIAKVPIAMLSDPWHRVERHDSRLRLAALPTAVGCARRFAQHTLQAWLLDHVADLGDTVDLVVSELVTNAIQATGSIDPRPRYADLYDQRIGVVVLRLYLAEVSIVVEVYDRDPNPPLLREPTLESEDGRGLLLVDAVSTTWGHYLRPAGGKAVWAELPIAATPPTDSRTATVDEERDRDQ